MGVHAGIPARGIDRSTISEDAGAIVTPRDGQAAVADLRGLLDGDYQRSGPDLIIVSPDGARTVVRDFFALDPHPDLTGPDGAVVAGPLAARLAGPIAPAQVAQAGEAQVAQAAPIGTVETVKGTVTIERADGTVIQATPGTPVYQGDIVITGDASAVGLVFADETEFALASRGRMTLDEMIYDPDTGDGSANFNLLSGTFSFVSGQLAKAGPGAMMVTTPVATIGIRGTSGTIGVGAGGEGAQLKVVLIPDANGTVGEIQVTTPSGESFTINLPMGAFKIENGQPQTFTMSLQEFNAEFREALGGLRNGDGLQQGVERVAPPTPEDAAKVDAERQQQQNGDGPEDGGDEGADDTEAQDDTGEGEGEGEGPVDGETEGDTGEGDEGDEGEGEGDEGEGEGEGDGDGEIVETEGPEDSFRVTDPIDIETGEPSRGGIDATDGAGETGGTGGTGTTTTTTTTTTDTGDQTGDDDTGGDDDDEIVTAPVTDDGSSSDGPVYDVYDTVTGSTTYNQSASTLRIAVQGDSANNTIFTGSGNDAIDGGAGNDYLEAGAGNDSVKGGDGDDTIIGGSGAGDDWYAGGDASTDTSTNDWLLFISTSLGVTVTMPIVIEGILHVGGTASGDEIGIDHFIGIEHVKGGDGDDVFYTGTTSGSLVGGLGDDTYVWTGLGDDTLVETAAGGTDTLDLTNLSDISVTVTRDASNNVVLTSDLGSVTLNNVEVLLDLEDPNDSTPVSYAIQTTGAVMTGTAGRDLLIAEDSGANMDGGDGNDLLIGGSGNDTLKGGLGDDEFIYTRQLDSGHDIIEDAGGIDTLTFDGDAAMPYRVYMLDADSDSQTDDLRLQLDEQGLHTITIYDQVVSNSHAVLERIGVEDHTDDHQMYTLAMAGTDTGSEMILAVATANGQTWDGGAYDDVLMSQNNGFYSTLLGGSGDDILVVDPASMTQGWYDGGIGIDEFVVTGNWSQASTDSTLKGFEELTVAHGAWASFRWDVFTGVDNSIDMLSIGDGGGTMKISWDGNAGSPDLDDSVLDLSGVAFSGSETGLSFLQIHGRYASGAETIVGTTGNDEIWSYGYDGAHYDGGGGTTNEIVFESVSMTTGDTSVIDVGAGTFKHYAGGSSLVSEVTFTNFDMVIGSSQVDTIVGSAGDDWIGGHMGNDTLTGGGGADTFDFTTVTSVPGFGRDTITDWGSEDRIALGHDVDGTTVFDAWGTASDHATFRYFEATLDSAQDFNFTNAATDFGTTGAGIIVMGTTTGTDQVEIYYSTDLSAATSANSYQIAVLDNTSLDEISDSNFFNEYAMA